MRTTPLGVYFRAGLLADEERADAERWVHKNTSRRHFQSNLGFPRVRPRLLILKGLQPRFGRQTSQFPSFCP